MISIKLTVYSSIRLKDMREGMGDYELLRTLAHSRPGEARNLAESMGPGFTSDVRELVQFRRLHRQLLELLSKQ